ncbi:carboxypeptidase regulatory-like domain-containing protein [Nitrospira sp. M1]
MNARYTFWLSVPLVSLGLWNPLFAYETTEVVNPGTLSGHVTFEGKILAPRTFTVQKNPEICGQTRSLTKVSVNDGKLQGAVIALEGITRGKAFEEKHIRADRPGQGEFHYRAGDTLDLEVRTKKCNFGPFTGVLARDEPIQFTNNDSIKHTLHTYVLRGNKATILKTVHNRGIPALGTLNETFTHKKLKQPGVVAITCDRHDFMENWLYVADSPYFAISDEQGRFNIDQIPPGTYTMVVWHPVLGTQKHNVTITPQHPVTLNLEFVKK